MIARFMPYLRLAPYAAIALLALYGAIQAMQARHWHKRYIGAEKAHSATVAAYTGAQIAAAELNRAKVAQIEREYETIAQRTESEYETRLIDNRRAVADFMRRQAAKGNSSSTGTSQAATMSGQAMQATDTAIVPVADLEIVADAYAQLDALRMWALDIGKVK